MRRRLAIASPGIGALVVAGLFARAAFAADPEKGKAVFEQCAACHTLDAASGGDGPTLQGVIGRKAGTRTDYRYSSAMVRSGVTWDAMSLDAYVTDPQAFIPGNRMPFAGIPDKAQRDDLIAYLSTVK